MLSISSVNNTTSPKASFGVKLEGIHKRQFLENLFAGFENTSRKAEMTDKFEKASEFLPKEEMKDKDQNDAVKFIKNIAENLKKPENKDKSFLNIIGDTIGLAKNDVDRLFTNENFAKKYEVLENDKSFDKFTDTLTDGLYDKNEKVYTPELRGGYISDILWRNGDKKVAKDTTEDMWHYEPMKLCKEEATSTDKASTDKASKTKSTKKSSGKSKGKSTDKTENNNNDNRNTSINRSGRGKRGQKRR